MLRTLWIPIAFALLLIPGCGRLPGPNGANPGGTAAPANPAANQNQPGGAAGGNAAPDQSYARYVSIAGEATRHVRDVEGAYVTMRQTGDYEQVRGRFNSAREGLMKLMGDLEALPKPSPEQVQKLASNKVVDPLADAIYKASRAEERTMRDFIRIGFWRDPLDPARRITYLLGYTRSFGPAGAQRAPNPSDPPAVNTQFADLSVFGPGGGLLPALDPDSPAAVPYRVAVDPAAVPYEILPDLKLGIDVPGFPQRNDRFASAWESSHVRLLYPATASTVVAAGLNEKSNESREVWTVSPRRKIGRIHAIQLGNSKVMAISPDGLYFAARPEGSNLVGLYDVAKDKPVGTVPLGEEESVEFLAFGAENRLLGGMGDSVSVWSVPSLELEREISLKSTLSKSPFAAGYSWSLSPGGRYLVAPHRSLSGALYFYDVTTGEIAGGLEVIDHGDLMASAFSDDGTQLAVLASTPWKARLQTWDVASGVIVDEWVFDERLDRSLEPEREYQGPAIDWFPDGKRLLVHGQGIFDTERGSMTGTLPDKTFYRIKPLAGNSIAVIQRKQLVAYDMSAAPESNVSTSVADGGFGAEVRVGPNTGNPPQRTPRSAPQDTPGIPSDFRNRMEEARARAGLPPIPTTGRSSSQSGFGAARSARSDDAPANNTVTTRPDLPELTSVNRAGIELVALQPPESWNVTARSSNPSARPSQPVEIPQDDLFAVAISDDASRAVAMYSSQRPSTHESVLSNIRIHFDPIDLQTGTQHPSIELPLASGLLDVAPDGSRMVTRSLSQPNRIDIWELPQGDPIASLRPYPQGTYQGGQAVAWAAFLDPERLLTMGGGRITLWTLPEAQAVYELLADDTTVPALDPSRELMARAAADGSGVLLVNTRDGSAAGFVPRDSAQGAITSLAFNAAGSSLVLGTRSSHSGELAVVDLATGDVPHTFPVPIRPAKVQWCGTDRLLVNGAYLMDIGTGALVWIYDAGSWGRHLVDSPDGRHWYLAPKSATEHKTLFLTAAELPEPAALAKIANPAPPSLVLQPGGRIGLDLQMPSPPGSGNFASEVRAAFAEKYQSSGITIDDSAPLKLSVQGKSEKTGDVLTTSLFRFGPRRSGDIEIDEQQVTWTITLSLSGQMLWQTELSATNAVSVTIDTDDSAAAQQSSVEQQTIQKMWENAGSRLLNFDPPRHLFAPESVKGLGRSTLSPEGVVANVE